MATETDETPDQSEATLDPVAPGPADPASEDLASVHRLQVAITRLARTMRREVQAVLTPTQASVLTTIRVEGPITLGELAERERVAPPSITRMVARFEEDGYVERSTDPSDARVCRVEITAAAEAMVAEARQKKATWLIERLATLPEDSRNAILEAADALETLAELP